MNNNNQQDGFLNTLIAFLLAYVCGNSSWDMMREISHLNTHDIILYTIALVVVIMIVQLCVKKIQHANVERKHRKELEEKERFYKYLDEYTNSK